MTTSIPEHHTLLTPAEVASMFRVDAKTVTRWANAGKLTCIRTLGGHRRYRESEVRALLNPEPVETPAPEPVPACASWCPGRHDHGDPCRLTVGTTADSTVTLEHDGVQTWVRRDHGPDQFPVVLLLSEARGHGVWLREQQRDNTALADLVDAAVALADGGQS